MKKLDKSTCRRAGKNCRGVRRTEVRDRERNKERKREERYKGQKTDRKEG